MSKEVEVPTVTDKPINTTGNKFTRNHSPRSEEDDSNPELNLDSQDTQVSSTMDWPEVPDERVPTPTILVGTTDPVIEELDREATAHTQLLVQPSPTQQQQTGKVKKYLALSREQRKHCYLIWL